MQTRTAVRPRGAADGWVRAPLAVALVINAVLVLAAPGLRPVWAALGTGRTATGTPAVGTCDNVYFPVTLDIKREYRTSYASGGVPPVTHVETFRAITAESFTQRLEFTDGAPAVEQVWNCGGDGLISSHHGGNGAPGGRLKIETIKRQGITIPAADQWRVGKRWESTHDLRSTPVVAAARDGKAGGTEGKIVIASEIVAHESVTTAAGTFDALKVRFTVDQEVTVAMRGSSFPVKSAFRGFSWYAKDVGLVKTVVENLTTTELVSVTK